MNEMINDLKKYNLPGLENIDLLKEVYKNKNNTKKEISYQITPLLMKMLDYSRIYLYLDADDQTVIHDIEDSFYKKIMYITGLCEQITNQLIVSGYYHPVLYSNMDLESMYDMQEECISILYEIINNFSSETELSMSIKKYNEMLTNLYQINFINKVIPKLKICKRNNDYKKALNILNEYVTFKINIDSGQDDNNSLYMSYIAEGIHKLMDNEIISYIEKILEYNQLYQQSLDETELTDEEYLNLLYMMFENRYLAQKSYKLSYNNELIEVKKYDQKCKKM